MLPAPALDLAGLNLARVVSLASPTALVTVAEATKLQLNMAKKAANANPGHGAIGGSGPAGGAGPGASVKQGFGQAAASDDHPLP